MNRFYGAGEEIFFPVDFFNDCFLSISSPKESSTWEICDEESELFSYSSVQVSVKLRTVRCGETSGEGGVLPHLHKTVDFARGDLVNDLWELIGNRQPNEEKLKVYQKAPNLSVDRAD